MKARTVMNFVSDLNEWSGRSNTRTRTFDTPGHTFPPFRELEVHVHYPVVRKRVIDVLKQHQTLP